MTRSWASSEHARRTMVANRSIDTKPELIVRSLLHARGLRYRIHFRPEPSLRRTADIVFTRRRVAVFIDGCFWHGCTEHRAAPRTNTEFWVEKFRRNTARDRDTDRSLEAAGWTVLRFWEHEDPVVVTDNIEASVRSSPIDSSSERQPPLPSEKPRSEPRGAPRSPRRG